MRSSKETKVKAVTESIVVDNDRQLGTVEGKVRAVVRMIEGVNYIYNDWTKANIDLDKVPTPCVVFIQPSSGNFDVHNGKARDMPDCAIAFLDRTVHDDDAVSEDCVVERMKRLALRFIDAVNKSGYFEPIHGNVKYQVPIDTTDSINSGIIIEPVLKETTGQALCMTNPRR
ncbi:hypothetical protein BFS16_00565 [Hoylesella timonensis]|jgi:hypothetical protein|uniref:Uncharacterized protein n=1 Tax=Hoylesella timonensis TaxID=386414 RepID=A0A2K0XPG1_9BACT|nr:hypothetical protein [Hoylesella timonensis]PNP96411.1 hypothetical protein BFS16_00565 [Hoylesella timonensis]